MAASPKGSGVKAKRKERWHEERADERMLERTRCASIWIGHPRHRGGAELFRLAFSQCLSRKFLRPPFRQRHSDRRTVDWLFEVVGWLFGGCQKVFRQEVRPFLNLPHRGLLISTMICIYSIRSSNWKRSRQCRDAADFATV